MPISLAMVATQFLDRPGLAQKTVKSYEHTLMPLLAQYGSWPIEIWLVSVSFRHLFKCANEV